MRAAVIACLLLFARPALADDAAKRLAAIKTMFDAQTKSFIADDDNAFKATLTPDALVAFGGDYPRTDFSQWNAVRAQKIVVAASKMGWAGTWGWLVAELRITYTWYAEPAGAGNPHPTPETHTYHYAALVVADGAGVKSKALRMTQTRSDSYLSSSDEVQTLLPIASPPPNIALLAKPAAIAAQLAKDPATSVLGTSEGDRGFGATDAKHLVAGWSKLVIEVVDTPDAHDKPVEVTVGDGAVAWAKLRMKLPGKPKWYAIDGFAILRKVGDRSEIVALVYGT